MSTPTHGRGRGSLFVRAIFGLETALGGILSQKLRSTLTVLGVAIGVASLIILLAIGNGARVAIARQFESLGTNLIKVTTDRWDIRLKVQDVPDLLERIPTVDAGMPVVIEESVNVKYRRLVDEVPLMGVSEDFPGIREHDLLEGRFFGPLHVQERMRVAVLGYDAWRQLFGSINPVGHGVYIGGQRFTVLGILERKGEGMAGDIDQYVVVPVTAAQRVLLTGRVDELWFQSPDEKSVDAAMVQLGSIFRHKFNIGGEEDMPDKGAPDDVKGMMQRRGGEYLVREGKYPPWEPQSSGPPLTITSMNTMVEEASEASRVMTMMLGGIASVALLVGGLGIMNIMLVSVTERTREIGIRKALGAHPGDIVYQFMMEALVLGLVGGALGLTMGFLGTGVAARYGLETLLTLQSTGVAFVAAVAIAIMFGVYPAFAAAQMEPVEALRHR
ncbi:MAG: ABC transporter permease [Clostridia bacterium]